MELRQLHTFKTVVETKGFTRAASALSYAQSSVTAQIQALEEELGVKLFDRLGKRVILTAAGERLLPYATQMLELQETILHTFVSDTIPSGTLSIGAPESLAAFRLPAIIRAYTHMYPDVKITLRPGVCWELRNLARSGELDIVFLLEPEVREPDLHIEILIHEPMAVIAPPDHSLAALPSVQTTDFHRYTFLHTEPGCSYRTLFEQHLRNYGIVPDASLEFWSIEAIKNCVLSGLGLAFLPLITVQQEIKDQRLVSLMWDDTDCRVATQMAYHKNKWLSPALQEFIQVVHAHVDEWKKEAL